MKISILVLILFFVTGCGKSKSSVPQPLNSPTKQESIFGAPGIKNLGLSFVEVGHRTSEDHYVVTCTDNDEFTNQERLDNLKELLKNIGLDIARIPKVLYRVECQDENGCTLKGAQMEALIKEAISTLKYYEVLLPSKYCPNNILTPKGIVILKE